MKQLNQGLELALSYLANPIFLVLEAVGGNTHNSLTSSTTGLSPFQCAYGFQPPLFPVQEREVIVPSVQAHMEDKTRH